MIQTTKGQHTILLQTNKKRSATTNFPIGIRASRLSWEIKILQLPSRRNEASRIHLNLTDPPTFIPSHRTTHKPNFINYFSYEKNLFQDVIKNIIVSGPAMLKNNSRYKTDNDVKFLSHCRASQIISKTETDFCLNIT